MAPKTPRAEASRKAKPRPKYQSPTDYAPPVYPSPNDYIRLNYPSPANLGGLDRGVGRGTQNPLAPVSQSPTPPSFHSVGSDPSGLSQLSDGDLLEKLRGMIREEVRHVVDEALEVRIGQAATAGALPGSSTVPRGPAALSGTGAAGKMAASAAGAAPLSPADPPAEAGPVTPAGEGVVPPSPPSAQPQHSLPLGNGSWLPAPVRGGAVVHRFSSPDMQATWDPLILEQCQKIGLATMLKTMEAAAPKQRYGKITQGPREPFLQLEKIAAALEKQVEDNNLRQLCKLAKDNANVDYLKIIQALPGDSSLMDMIQACAKVGTIDHEIATIAAAMWQQQKMSGGGNKRQGKKNGKKQKKPQQQQANNRPTFLCAKCKKPGHYANQCKTKNFVLSASGGGAWIQMAPQNPAVAQHATSTRGSAGVDVHTADTVVIDSAGVHKVPLGAFGPLGHGLSALLVGQSSATIQGIFVHPGVIDADFTGWICAMVSTPCPPVTIPAGTRIAQLGKSMRLERRRIWIHRNSASLLDNEYLQSAPTDGVHSIGADCQPTPIQLRDTGVRWLPARCVRPDLQQPRQNVANAQPSNTDQHADQQPDGPSTSRSRK
ncbi:hypothetical protein Nmel_000745 [Mimus melanotis]